MEMPAASVLTLPGRYRTGRYMQRLDAATADGFAVPTAATLAIPIVVWSPPASPRPDEQGGPTKSPSIRLQRH